MPANPSFTKFQKERKRQEKATAKRQERNERKRRNPGSEGAGPPIDYDARPMEEFAPMAPTGRPEPPR